MFEHWSLRLRVFLFFALIGLAGAAAIAAAMGLAAVRIGEGRDLASWKRNGER